MFDRGILVHYHEIGLKGRNRAIFERRLRDNLASALESMPIKAVELMSSRLIVRLHSGAGIDDLCRLVAGIPGVAYAAAAFLSSREEYDMNAAAVRAVAEVPGAKSFSIQARRSNTDHPICSMDTNRIIGQHVADHTGLRVNLSNPEVTCFVEVVQGEALIFSRKFPGTGGLPVGTAGTVISLLSAGIDSPVATWRLMKRGAVAVGVHFSGRPQTDDRSERLVNEIGSVLAKYGGIGRIYIVPFGDFQHQIALAAPPHLRVLLYRRLMIRVAEQFATVEGAKALVTGESLGQVASQTLENIAAVDDAAKIPVLRPLIGSNKLEIINEARAIGTYDLSTVEHIDCCTLFMPRRPATRATVDEVRAAEEGFDVDRMVAECVSSAVYRDFGCPAYRPPVQLPDGVAPAGERS